MELCPLSVSLGFSFWEALLGALSAMAMPETGIGEQGPWELQSVHRLLPATAGSGAQGLYKEVTIK